MVAEYYENMEEQTEVEKHDPIVATLQTQAANYLKSIVRVSIYTAGVSVPLHKDLYFRNLRSEGILCFSHLIRYPHPNCYNDNRSCIFSLSKGTQLQ